MNHSSGNQILLDSLNEQVEGHIHAKKSLITMLQRSNMRYYQKYLKNMDSEFLLDPMKILLIGGSGTGKTLLLNTLAQAANFPLVKVDASQFNVTGGSGGIKVGHLKKMIKDEAELCCKLYPNRFFSLDGAIDRTVVFVDEIDKLGGQNSVGEWNKGVQSSFLTLFDDKDEFSGVSFVFAGAFSDITKYSRGNKSLGFTPAQDDAVINNLDDQIVSSGILPELIGRINTIVELDVFSVQDLFKIAKDKILAKKQRDLAAYHIFDVELSDERLLSIAKDAFKSSQGIRYLKRLIDKEFLDIEFDVNIDGVMYNDF